eukprot:1149387-Pelagomonas_calceolata.AAC.6
MIERDHLTSLPKSIPCEQKLQQKLDASLTNIGCFTLQQHTLTTWSSMPCRRGTCRGAWNTATYEECLRGWSRAGLRRNDEDSRAGV